jgi:hypothetical protein
MGFLLSPVTSIVTGERVVKGLSVVFIQRIQQVLWMPFC